MNLTTTIVQIVGKVSRVDKCGGKLRALKRAKRGMPRGGLRRRAASGNKEMMMVMVVG